jgi:hypothetical protein
VRAFGVVTIVPAVAVVMMVVVVVERIRPGSPESSP